jgi:hypothetical protein
METAMQHKPNTPGWYEEMTSDTPPVKVRSHQSQFTVEYIIEGDSEASVTAEAENLARNYYGYGCMMGSARERKDPDTGRKIWTVTGHRGIRC